MRAGLLVLSWAVLNSALAFNSGIENWAGLSTRASFTLCASLVAIPATEMLLLCVIIGSAKSIWLKSRMSALAIRILEGFAVTLGAGFVAFVFLGWVFASYGFGFLKLSVVTGALADLVRVSGWMTSSDVIVFSSATAVGLIFAIGLFRVMPPLRNGELARLGGTAALSLGILVLCAHDLPGRLGHREAARVEAILRIGLLPSSDIWRLLLFVNRTEPTAVTVPLRPREAETTLKPLTAGRPNLLLISIESLRGGEEVRREDGAFVMPTVNRLASEGVHFTRAYAPSNESAYSLAAIIVSNHLLKTPARDTFVRPLRPYVRIYDRLHDQYATGFFSASPEGWQNMKAVSWSPALDRFFDASSTATGHLTIPETDTGFGNAVRRGLLATGDLDDRVPTEALKSWIDELPERHGSKPFFALIKYDSSHFPYQQGLSVPVRFAPSDLSEKEMRSMHFYWYPRELAGKMRRRYWNSLSYVDGLIGELLDHLRTKRLLENTVVMVFGDHGQLFHENGAVTHAARLSEASLHTALVVWGAKGWPAQRYDHPVSLLDIGPMALSLAGLPPYGGFQGQIPARLGDGASLSLEPRPVFSVAQNVRFEETVLFRNWRYVRQADGLYEHLYDVQRDPFEFHDRVGDRPDVLECLHMTLMQFRQNQLGYYRQPDLFQFYFPPQHGLAEGSLCGWAM